MRKRILIVDDDPDILASLAIIFQESYEVALARDGAEALRFLDEGPHDVVLLDLMMPVLDGVAFMQELAARRARVPVILASASATLVASARELGAVDYIGKPFDIQRLEEKVARALEGRTSGSPGGSPGVSSNADFAPRGSGDRHEPLREGSIRVQADGDASRSEFLCGPDARGACPERSARMSEDLAAGAA